jgi:rhodanese-related sulfurtransferase
MKNWIYVVLILVIFVSTPSAVMAQHAPRLEKEALKEELDNPDVIVIDVRSASQWKASEWKIKNSVWEDPTEIESWANFKYSRENTFVLSCA